MKVSLCLSVCVSVYQSAMTGGIYRAYKSENFNEGYPKQNATEAHLFNYLIISRDIT